MRIGSLFTGYGGLDMAAEAAFGAETAWVADIDKGACKVLAHRYPGVPNLGDITAVDWSTVEPVDIITGGSPCQDLSHAGRRAGMTEGTRSNLWVAMREAIAQIRPTYVIWENVRGAFSADADSAVEPCPGCVGDGSAVLLRALGRVLGDLSDLGYDTQWRGLRASDVGAPHGRFRAFVVARLADADGARLGGVGRVDRVGRDADRRGGADKLRHNPEPPASLSLLPSPRTSDTNGAGQHGDGGMDLRTAVTLLPTVTARDWKNAGDPGRTAERMAHRGQPLTEIAVNLLPTPTTAPTTGNGHARNLGAEAQLMPTPSVADALGGHERRGGARGDELLLNGMAKAGHLDRFGQYAPAIARWEAVTGHPAPEPTEPTGRGGAHRLSPRFTEWMMGLPAGWITDVPDVTRNEALTLCGNGVVQRQAHTALVDCLRAWAVMAA